MTSSFLSGSLGVLPGPSYSIFDFFDRLTGRLCYGIKGHSWAFIWDTLIFSF